MTHECVWTVVAEFDLPDLPAMVDACDTDSTTVELVLFREQLSDENIPFAYVSESDAREYCDREDTHGTDAAGHGWFVGWRRLV